MRHPDEQAVTVADRIKRARDEKGLSKSELARMIGVSRRQVQRWENEGDIPTRAEALDGLGKVLGLSPEDLGVEASAPVSTLLQRLLEGLDDLRGEIRELRGRVQVIEDRQGPPEPGGGRT